MAAAHLRDFVVRRIGGATKALKGGRDVYVFFDNTDVKLRAPVDARRMAKVLGVGPEETVPKVLNELGVKPKGSARTKGAKSRKRKTAE